MCQALIEMTGFPKRRGAMVRVDRGLYHDTEWMNLRFPGWVPAKYIRTLKYQIEGEWCHQYKRFGKQLVVTIEGDRQSGYQLCIGTVTKRKVLEDEVRCDA